MNYIDTDAEFSFIGNLMVQPERITSFLNFEDDVFSEVLCAKIYSLLKQAFYEGNKLTPNMIAKTLAVDPNAVMAIAKSAISIDLPISADTLKTLYKKRKLAEKLQIASDTLQSKVTADDAVQDILDFMSEIESGKDRLRVKTTGEVFQTIQDSLNNPSVAIKTGLAALDAMLQGGFIRGKSYSISARKKVGKTALLGQLAVNLANDGYNVLYIALEMGSEQIMHRMLGRYMEFNPIAFMTEQKQSDRFKDSFGKAIKAFPKNLRFIDGAGMTFGELKAVLTRESRRIDCFFLDYWQLVGGKPKNKSTSEFLDETAQWLSEYARRNNILNITATQLNQEDNTRGSEGIRLAYDMTMILHRIEETEGRWLEMTDTRYTPFLDVGGKNEPRLMLNNKGVFFYDV